MFSRRCVVFCKEKKLEDLTSILLGHLWTWHSICTEQDHRSGTTLSICSQAKTGMTTLALFLCWCLSICLLFLLNLTYLYDPSTWHLKKKQSNLSMPAENRLIHIQIVLSEGICNIKTEMSNWRVWRIQANVSSWWYLLFALDVFGVPVTSPS